MSHVSLYPKIHVCRLRLSQSALAKERRELKEQQQRTLLDAIPKDLSKPWEVRGGGGRCGKILEG